MTKRIAATEQTRERLRALIDGRLGTGADRSDLVRMAVQLIVEEVLEGEARDKLGRKRYERAEGVASGYRNGYRKADSSGGGWRRNSARDCAFSACATYSLRNDQHPMVKASTTFVSGSRIGRAACLANDGNAKVVDAEEPG